jgi:hypothetical protein
MNLQRIRAISLWNPWALLVAIEAKRYETRHWTASYRGPLIIHAAKKWDGDLRNTCRMNVFKAALEPKGYSFANVGETCGAALCVVDLVAIHRTADLVETINSSERKFGDWTAGRYAWEIQNVRRFRQPIPMKGHQGFWDDEVDLDELEPVLEMAVIPNQLRMF